MKFQLVADENIPGVETLFGPEVEVRRVAGRQICRESLGRAEILLVRSVTRVDAQLLEGSAVKFVGTATSGTDHIDLRYLADAGIAFAHAPGSNANSVVEYVLAAIAGIDDYLERLLAGATVGVVGYGNIGRALAARLQALGIRYLVNDPWLDPAGVEHASTLERVMACEVICLHPELTRKQPWPSYHLLGEAALAGLASGQLLINASRGPVIDNQALYRRMQGDVAPDVVLDVWESEPLVPARLLQAVRLGTAHIAGYSHDGKLLATLMLRDAAQHSLGTTFATRKADDMEKPARLTVDGPQSPARLLRGLLASCYDIGDDDRRLREAIAGHDEEQCRENFDHLRKHYPRRRELAGREVVLGAGNEQWRDMVLALGCRPVEES